MSRDLKALHEAGQAASSLPTSPFTDGEADAELFGPTWDSVSVAELGTRTQSPDSQPQSTAARFSRDGFILLSKHSQDSLALHISPYTSH